MKFKKCNRWRNNGGQLRYKTWRTNVFKLNKGRLGLSKYYVCTKCNKKRKTTRVLHAHHIFSWHNYPKLRYEMKNGKIVTFGEPMSIINDDILSNTFGVKIQVNKKDDNIFINYV